MTRQYYTIVSHDWINLEFVINDLSSRVTSQELFPTSSPTFTGVSLTTLSVSGTVTFDTALTVPSGGTGLSTITDHGIMLGSGVGAITPLGVAANGQVPIGSAGADPVLAEITGTANQITSTAGAGTITLSLPQDIHTGASPTFAGLTVTNAAVVGSDSVVFKPNSDSTTFLQVLDADGGTPVFNVDTTNERVMIGGDDPGEKFVIGSDDGTDRINIWHNNTNPAFQWDDGNLQFQSTEAGTATIVQVLNNGANLPSFQVRNNADSVIWNIQASANRAIFNGAGAGLVAVSIQSTADAPVELFSFATAGETPELKISGRSVGSGSRKTLEIGTEIDADDTVSFDGLSNYQFNDGSIVLHNFTHEDTDGGRESRIIAKGEQSGGEETTLGYEEWSHDGASDDEKGQKRWYVNAGSDGDTPTLAMTLDSGLDLTLVNALAVPSGGTALATITDHSVMLGSGTGAVTPTAVGVTDDLLVGNTGADPTWKTATVDIPIVLSMFDAVPSRGIESNWNGGLLLLTAGTISSPTATQLGPATPANDISVSKGVGKILVVVVAGSDVAGTFTITGEKIDRSTGASTPAHTNVITVDAVTTDGSADDSNGNRKHAFTGAYISDDWFTGTVVLSTSTLNLTCYVFHVSFEQFNDQPSLTLNTFDANVFTTNVSAEFDAYLYDLHKEGGNKCDIENHAELHVGADGETAIADKYWRLRRGGIAEALDGTTDGVWVDVHYANSPVYVEDVTVKVWATCSQTLTLT